MAVPQVAVVAVEGSQRVLAHVSGDYPPGDEVVVVESAHHRIQLALQAQNRNREEASRDPRGGDGGKERQ